jgi:hypothetical protein
MAAAGPSFAPTDPYQPVVDNPLKPSPWPARPDLSDEVTWAPLPSREDYRRAYRLWDVITSEIRVPEGADNADDTAATEHHAWMGVLGSRVYEKVMRERYPSEGNDERVNVDALKRRFIEDAVNFRLSDLFPDEDTNGEPVARTPVTMQDVVVDGHEYTDKKYWIKERLRAALEARGLPPGGINDVRKDRLFQYEADVRNGRAQWHGDAFRNRLPRADLTAWGIQREDQFVLNIQSPDGLTPLDCLTWAILLSGYNPTYWVSRAYLYYEMGYFDLALGDCYRAFRLIETLVGPARRNMQHGLFVRVWDALQGHLFIFCAWVVRVRKYRQRGR